VGRENEDGQRGGSREKNPPEKERVNPKRNAHLDNPLRIARLGFETSKKVSYNPKGSWGGQTEAVLTFGTGKKGEIRP